jgi:hypothetical protein
MQVNTLTIILIIFYLFVYLVAHIIIYHGSIHDNRLPRNDISVDWLVSPPIIILVSVPLMFSIDYLPQTLYYRCIRDVYLLQDPNQ